MQAAEDVSILGIKSDGSERLAQNRSAFSTAALLSERLAKRAFDVLVAIAGLVIFAPTFLLVAMAIKIESRGSVFTRQVGRGCNNELIWPLRFRTTNENVGDNQVTTRRSPLTHVGSALRYSGVEDLPLLINILRGEISLVGPRLRTVSESSFVDEQQPQGSRQLVKPGIIGWAQVDGCRGASAGSSKEVQQQIEHLHYVENGSFLLDLKIVLMTLLSKATYQ